MRSMNNLQDRQHSYYRLNSQLSELSHSKLLRQVKASPFTTGWGINHSFDWMNHKIFVKRIPLTTREYEQSFSTKNFFRLPNYYHYGVGSAGFGAFRELICHIKTTNWVLKGDIENFPLLYHYRILKSHAPWKKRSEESFNKYLTYWNDNQRIASYIQMRQEAPYEIALFLEYIPHSLHNWFEQKPLRNFKSLIHQSQQALLFLKQQGILHLDAHFANILTNGEQAFISDFGLALNKHFELGKREQDFFESHQDYDQGQLLSGCGILLNGFFKALSDKKQAQIYSKLDIPEDVKVIQLVLTLLQKLEFIQPQLLIDSELYEYLLTHRDLICFMLNFYSDLRDNPRKNTRLDTDYLRRYFKV